MRVPGIGCEVEVLSDSDVDSEEIMMLTRRLIIQDEGSDKWTRIHLGHHRLVMQNGFYFLIGNTNRQIYLKAL